MFMDENLDFSFRGPVVSPTFFSNDERRKKLPSPLQRFFFHLVSIREEEFSSRFSSDVLISLVFGISFPAIQCVTNARINEEGETVGLADSST